MTDLSMDEDLFMTDDMEPDDSIHELQISAQSKINEGQISDAIKDYQDIIQKGQRLTSVIADLNKAAQKYPQEVSIFQTLGDAYLQANKLQEALEAYTKAQNLLK